MPTCSAVDTMLMRRACWLLLFMDSHTLRAWSQVLVWLQSLALLTRRQVRPE